MSEKPSEKSVEDTGNVWSPELIFRYSAEQVLEFTRYMDRIYERQMGLIPDLYKVVIVRAVGQTVLASGHGTNALSIAEALGLPRETTRRKCRELVEDAWLVRRGNELLPGPALTPDVLEMVDENIDRMIEVSKRIENSAE